jgi:hypothetical protein
MTIRHNCETHGCYIKKMTPDWGFLDSSFSNKIRVGDIDGIVEANGRLLILEWKTTGANLPQGQEIMFKNITHDGKITVLVIWGDPEETHPTHYQLFWDGKKRPQKTATVETIKDFCKWWEGLVRSLHNICNQTTSTSDQTQMSSCPAQYA